MGEALTATNVFAWPLPPRDLSLFGGEVHVWRAALDRPGVPAEELVGCLDAGERERAERFRFRQDRDRFVVARWALRSVLGLYLGQRPGELRFNCNAFGKPYLDDGAGRGALRFNVSRSHGLALFAVARGLEVGVDVEYVRADASADKVARRFFSQRETSELSKLTPSLRPKAFFTCWTRKEAYVKARGEGLSLALNSFTVSVTPRETAALLSAECGAYEIARWSLRELDPGPGYVGAVAVGARVWQLKCYEYQL